MGSQDKVDTVPNYHPAQLPLVSGLIMSYLPYLKVGVQRAKVP